MATWPVTSARNAPQVQIPVTGAGLLRLPSSDSWKPPDSTDGTLSTSTSAVWTSSSGSKKTATARTLRSAGCQRRTAWTTARRRSSRAEQLSSRRGRSPDAPFPPVRRGWAGRHPLRSGGAPSPSDFRRFAVVGPGGTPSSQAEPLRRAISAGSAWLGGAASPPVRRSPFADRFPPANASAGNTSAGKYLRPRRCATGGGGVSSTRALGRRVAVRWVRRRGAAQCQSGPAPSCCEGPQRLGPRPRGQGERAGRDVRSGGSAG